MSEKNASAPVPAPRRVNASVPAERRQSPEGAAYVNCNIDEDVDNKFDNESDNKLDNDIDAKFDHNETSKMLDEEDWSDEDELYALPDSKNVLSKMSKSSTLAIRQDVHKLWEAAVHELDLDTSLVSFLESRDTVDLNSTLNSSINSNKSNSGQKRRIVNGQSLLRDFDPCFDGQNLSEGQNEPLGSKKEGKNEVNEGFVDDNGADSTNDNNNEDSSDKEEELGPVLYENVWTQPPPPPPPRGPSSGSSPSSSARPLSVISSSSSPRQSECNEQLDLQVPQSCSSKRSPFSSLKSNLFKLSRKLSSSSLNETDDCSKCLLSGPLAILINHNASEIKWATLTTTDLRIGSHPSDTPKLIIGLQSVLSVSVWGRGNRFCFDLSFVHSKKQQNCRLRTFITDTEQSRYKWLCLLAGALSLPSLTMASITKTGRVNAKRLFASQWQLSKPLSIHLDHYISLEDCEEEDFRVDLKTLRKTSLVREVNNLKAPLSNVPVLVLDFAEASLYIQPKNEEETKHWKLAIEALAFAQSDDLSDQQVTKEGVPVIIELCLSFVFRHGCLTEGIYRHSGVKTKIDELLTAWRRRGENVFDACQLTRENYSEHDVANALKRYLRTMNDSLLTAELRDEWIAAANITHQDARLARYISLINRLPDINRRILRRLIGHLRSISNQSSHNLMPTLNLASSWGPTLLTVDTMEVCNFGRDSESAVCADLIENYQLLFDVDENELRREELMIKKTEGFKQNSTPIKLRGEVMMFVQVSTSHSVSIAVTPKMIASELTQLVIEQSGSALQSDTTNLGLFEVVNGGEMERFVRGSEIVYETTLKWAKWSESDRRETGLVLKEINKSWKEVLKHNKQTSSIFGELWFAGKEKKNGFKKCLVNVHQGIITRSKTNSAGVSTVLDTWSLSESSPLTWYMGFEPRRSPPTSFCITMIEEGKDERTKAEPFFGNTLCFSSEELRNRFMAAINASQSEISDKSNEKDDKLVLVE